MSLAQLNHFRQYSSGEGLYPYIYTTIQDPQGFIWVGTAEGFARFDGMQFRVFNTADGLAEDFVTTACFDHNETLWTGHNNGGISIRPKDSQRFTQLDTTGQLNARIRKLIPGKKGNIWCLTQGQGIVRISSEHVITILKGDLYGLLYDAIEFAPNKLLLATNEGAGVYEVKGDSIILTKRLGIIGSGKVKCIVPKQNGKGYWIGTERFGLFDYVSESEYTVYTVEDGLPSNHVVAVKQTDIDVLWVGSYSSGIAKLSIPTSEESRKLTVQRFGEQDGLTNVFVSDILEDYEGGIWIATNGGGLFQYRSAAFSMFHEGLTNGDVTSIFQDYYGNVWIGGKKGLRKMSASFLRGDDSTDKKLYLKDTYIKALLEDRGGRMLVGTATKGLFSLNPINGSIQDLSEGESFAIKKVNQIIEDKRGNIWIATQLNGVCQYDPATGKLKRYSFAEGYPLNRVNGLVEDSIGRIWLAAYQSKPCYFERDSLIIIDQMDPMNVSCVTIDRTANVWLGTEGDGVLKFDGTRFTRFSTDDGLLSNYCYQIVSDYRNNLWVGSRRGLSRFDAKKESFVSYAEKDGFLNVEFYENAVFSTLYNTILFGTSHGVLSLDARKRSRTTKGPKLYLTNLHVGDKAYPLTQNLTLPYDTYNLTFEYLGVSFKGAGEVIYQYKLEGHDLDWSPGTKENRMNYSQLTDGIYTFLVRASDRDGNWTEEDLSFSFVISTPLWKRWWFIGLVVLLLGMGVMTVYAARVNAIERQKAALEEIVQERTEALRKNVEILANTQKQLEWAKREAETASLAKTQFLANMSHEIRSPLNAIEGFSQILINRSEKIELPPDYSEFLKNINLASRNLTRLIGNILDLSKIEAGKMELQEEPTNIEQLVKNVYHINRGNAIRKQLQIYYDIQAELPRHIITDRTKLTQILMNLSSNAIKFTPQGKSVFIRALVEGEKMILEVEDEGIGISKERQAHIFDSFEQADKTITRRYGGTGLGLAITKEMAKMLGGTISVESEEGQGATFRVILPLRMSEEMAGGMESRNLSRHSFAKNNVVLAVEDNPLNRQMLVALFEDLEIPLHLAENGLEGIEKAMDLRPDLILMDVHMPQMSGLETVQKIRKIDSCKDIPIVALSADAFRERKKEALAIGFDDFLVKPVDFRELGDILLKYLRQTEKNEEKNLNGSFHKEQLPDSIKEEVIDIFQTMLDTPIFSSEKLIEYIDFIRQKTMAYENGYINHLDQMEDAVFNGNAPLMRTLITKVVNEADSHSR